MSEREAVAKRVCEKLDSMGLNKVYGCIESLITNKYYRSVTFCKARRLDGVVKLYRPRYIGLYWRTAYRTLPHMHQEVFKSVEDLERALEGYFGFLTRGKNGDEKV